MPSKPAIGIVLFLAVVAPASWAARKMYPMNVPAPGVKTIAFDVQEGDFVLRGDPSINEVQMRVSADRYWLFKLGEENILKKLIEVSGEGTNALTIRTKIEPSWRNWMRAEYPIDFEVVVPAGVKLNVHDTSGKIVVSEIRDEVAIDDTSGTLRVASVAGPVHIRKESGDIRVTDVAGAVNIDSKSGQMKVDRVGALSILRSDGNVYVADAKSADIHNRGGNLQVSGIAGPLVLDDESGEIQVSHVTGPVTIQDTSGQIRAADTGVLTIDDTSGDITVDRAPQLIVRTKESGAVKVKRVSGPIDVPAGIRVEKQ